MRIGCDPEIFAFQDGNLVPAFRFLRSNETYAALESELEKYLFLAWRFGSRFRRNAPGMDHRRNGVEGRERGSASGDD